jgi:hypothetical protein
MEEKFKRIAALVKDTFPTASNFEQMQCVSWMMSYQDIPHNLSERVQACENALRELGTID